jgi:hypothetical protein
MCPIEIRYQANGGDVVGAGTSLDNSIPRFDGTIGTDLQPTDIIIEDTTYNIDRGTNNTTLSIGATNANVINIGRSGCTVNILGSTNYIQTTNTQVSDTLLTLNKGGVAASAIASGIEFEEDSLITAYIKTSADRNSFEIKAPNANGIVTISPGSTNFTIDNTIVKSSTTTSNDNRIARYDSTSGRLIQESNVTIDDSGNTSGIDDLNISGTATIGSLSGVVKAATGVLSASTILNADIDNSAGITLSKLAAVTSDRVLVSDGSGIISASSTTTTTLGYLDATSSIQNQLNSKVSDTGDTMTGALVIDGSSDTNQLRVQGNGTQTNDIAVFENSAGDDYFTVQGNGNVSLGKSATTSKLFVVGNSQGDILTSGSEVFGLTIQQQMYTTAGDSAGLGTTLEFRAADAFGDTWTNAVIAGSDPVNGTYAGAIRFYINSGNASNSSANGRTKAASLFEAMRIRGDGRVGIGNIAPTAKLMIDGSADEVQLLVQGHSTQNNNIILIEKSDGTDLLTVSNNGATAIAGNVTTSQHYYSPVNDGTNFDEGDPTYSFTGDSDTGMYSEGANQINFATGGTERLRITSTGAIEVNSSSTSIFQSTTNNTSGNPAISARNLASAGSNTVALDLVFTNAGDMTNSRFVQFKDSDGTIGTITVASATTIAYNTSSDKRLKENFTDYEALPILNEIQSIKFNWIKDKKVNHGVIAQQLYEVFPEAVTVGGLDPKKDPWQVDPSKMVPLLIKSIQELDAKIEKKKIEKLLYEPTWSELRRSEYEKYCDPYLNEAICENMQGRPKKLQLLLLKREEIRSKYPNPNAKEKGDSEWL